MTGHPVTGEERALIEAAVARMRAGILAIVFAMLCGTGLFVATAWLLIKGGENVGATLGLLGNYLPGYSVTWPGAFLGLAYGAVDRRRDGLVAGADLQPAGAGPQLPGVAGGVGDLRQRQQRRHPRLAAQPPTPRVEDELPVEGHRLRDRRASAQAMVVGGAPAVGEVLAEEAAQRQRMGVVDDRVRRRKRAFRPRGPTARQSSRSSPPARRKRASNPPIRANSARGSARLLVVNMGSGRRRYCSNGRGSRSGPGWRSTRGCPESR